MRRIDATPETLMTQAGDTADVWLGQAVRSIDATFGDGYAKDHPELVSAFLKAASFDWMTSVFENSGDSIHNSN